MALAGKRRATKPKTAKQIAAAKKNLEKARAARSAKAARTTKVAKGSSAGLKTAVAGGFFKGGGTVSDSPTPGRTIAMISSRGIIGTHTSGTSGNTLNETGRKAVASQANKKAVSGKKVKTRITRGINSGKTHDAVDRAYKKAGYRSYPK